MTKPCGGMLLALVCLAAGAAHAQTAKLGTSSIVVGSAAGTNSVVLALTNQTASWTAAANASWLSLATAGGQGSTNVVFAYAANTGATRSNTLTIDGLSLAVTQAGTNYTAAQPLTTLTTSTLNTPYGVAVDGKGNVYIADTDNNKIKMWSPATNTVTTIVAAGLSYPAGVAVDGAGNLYIANTGSNTITKWTASSSKMSLLVTNLNNPEGVAVDAATNVYIADTFNNVIKKWTATNGSAAILISGNLKTPQGVAVDAAGNVYIADTGNNAIKEWMAATSNLAVLVPNLRAPSGVAVDGSGNVFFTDTYSNAIREWTAASAKVTTLVSSGLFYPSGLAVDGADNLYVADTVDDAIKELPSAFVATNALFETNLAGGSQLAAVLPANADLNGPFAPFSDTNWLALTGETNGVVGFTFLPNTSGSNRVATINLLGQLILVTQAAPLPSISTLAATDVSSNGATLNASVVPQSASAVYFVYGVSADYGNTVAVINFGSGSAAASVSYAVTGLSPGATYHFAAVATNSQGDTNGGDMTFTTLPGAPQATTLAATNVQYGDATLIGSANPQGAVTTVYFVYGTTTNYGSATSLAIITNATDVTNALAGLSPGAVYHFELIAFNSQGTNYGGDVTFTNTSSAAYSLGAASLVVGPAAGTNSVILSVQPPSGAWTASAGASWLHLPAAGGTGSANVIFSIDPNTNGPARSNTLVIAGQQLAVIQAGSNYVAASSVAVLSSNLSNPYGVAVDGAGNVYIADSGNNAILEWTLANNSTSSLVSANLSAPSGVAVDAAGNVYISDSGHNAVKEWSKAAGSVATLVSANLNNPSGLAVDAMGNVYIADAGNNAVKKWSVASNTTTTLASSLNNPFGVAVDAAGNVYIADSGNNSIQEWTAATSNLAVVVPNLNYPSGVAVDGSGNLYIADTFDDAIKKWSPAGDRLITLLSHGLPYPSGVAVDGTGNVYIANTGSNLVEELPYAFVNAAARMESETAANDALPQVLPNTENLLPPFNPASDSSWLTITGITNGVVSFSFATDFTANRTGHINLLGQSIAITQGGATFVLGATNLLEGPAAGSDSVVLASSSPLGSWTAASTASWLHLSAANQSGVGSTNVIFSFDANANSVSNRVGALTIGGQTLTVTQAGSMYVEAQTSAVLASNLSAPSGVAVDAGGNVYIANTAGNQIIEWTGFNNVPVTLPATNLNNPHGLAVDAGANLYIADSGNNAIKKWTAGNGVSTVVTNLNNPFGVAVDGSGNLYIADTFNNAIKEWTAANSNVITLVSSGLLFPKSVAVDAAGNVYIADSGHSAIKEWTAANGAVTTLVSATLNNPLGVAVDGSGNLYITDSGNNALKKWTAANENLIVLASALAGPAGVAVDGSGNLYIASTATNAVEELPYAYVDTSARFESNGTGSDQLPGVLPPTVNLSGPFAPVSDANWLTINSVAGGVVYFSFTANPNPGMNRTATINLLGQTISITQAIVGSSPPIFANLRVLTNGEFQFSFTNTPGASFTILSTTNLALPLSDWTVLGPPTATVPGQFQFTSPPTTNDAQVFYIVRSP